MKNLYFCAAVWVLFCVFLIFFIRDTESSIRKRGQEAATDLRFIEGRIRKLQELEKRVSKLEQINKEKENPEQDGDGFFPVNEHQPLRFK